MRREHQLATAAKIRYSAAGERFRAAVTKLYPVGSTVDVVLGGHLVRLKITGHSDWDYGTVHGENVITGNPRKFFAGFHEAEIVR